MSEGDEALGGKHVLFIATDLSSGGGVNKVIRDLAVLFTSQLGADVTVVNARSSAPSAYEFPPEVQVKMHERQPLLSYLRLLLRLRGSRPDVAISSWTQDNVLTALAFLGSGTRVVLVEHSSWHFHTPLIRLLRRLVYPLASALVVLNRRDLDHYRRYLRNVRLIPNSVKPPAIEPRREKLILCIGHLIPLKQFDHAIRVMAESRLEDDGWSLAIIGSGSEEERLRQIIRDLGLKRTRIHAGSENLAPWYARASLLLVPSRLESFSLVLAEAMAAGVVPIAYASDGPSFILEDFPDNLVEMGKVDQLAERLSRFACDKDLEPLRARLRQSVEDRFSRAVIADQWRQLFADL